MERIGRWFGPEVRTLKLDLLPSLLEASANPLRGLAVVLKAIQINCLIRFKTEDAPGNLDSQNSENIFRELSNKRGLSLLIVTHDKDFALRTDRIIEMEDGRILS